MDNIPDTTNNKIVPINTATAVEQSRAISEIQAALVVAASNKRNELVARDKLLQVCLRKGFAQDALYQYSRGGTAISGPSIRLAEAAARAWGNMTYGFRELARRDGESDCEAYAWDLESNTKVVRQFTVRHWRDTKTGGYKLKDERDIYELIANYAQRRVRAAIEEIIPSDIIDDAVEQCEATQKSSIGDIKKALEGLLEAFSLIGVTREMIELRLGCRVDAIQPAQVMSFRKIYTSIKDGMSSIKDWFEVNAIAKELQDVLSNENKDTGIEVETKDTKFEKIRCPNTDKLVSPESCEGRPCRNGCPEFPTEEVK